MVNQLIEIKYISPIYQCITFKKSCGRIITFLLLQGKNRKQSTTKEIEEHVLHALFAGSFGRGSGEGQGARPQPELGGAEI